MSSRLLTGILTTLGTLFALLALWALFWSPNIHELNNIVAIQLSALPSLFLSILMLLKLRVLGRRKAALTILWISTTAALFGIIGGYKGVLDLFTLKNVIYHGHQENNYTSLHLASIAVIPTIMVLAGWYYWRKLGRVTQAVDEQEKAI